MYQDIILQVVQWFGVQWETGNISEGICEQSILESQSLKTWKSHLIYSVIPSGGPQVKPSRLKSKIRRSYKRHGRNLCNQFQHSGLCVAQLKGVRVTQGKTLNSAPGSCPMEQCCENSSTARERDYSPFGNFRRYQINFFLPMMIKAAWSTYSKIKNRKQLIWDKQVPKTRNYRGRITGKDTARYPNTDERG